MEPPKDFDLLEGFLQEGEDDSESVSVSLWDILPELAALGVKSTDSFERASKVWLASLSDEDRRQAETKDPALRTGRDWLIVFLNMSPEVREEQERLVHGTKH